MESVSSIKQGLEARVCSVVNEAWLKACLVFLESQSSQWPLPVPRLLVLLEDQLLLSDLERSSQGCLPKDVATRHGEILKGQFLVQVQDCVNISEPSDRRYLHSPTRTLKLGLFDGKVSVSALELTHIPQISLDFPAGFKIILKDPKISRGMLVLTKENVKVLGGRVQSLVQQTEAIKAATQRSTLPQEWIDSLGQMQDLGTNTRLDDEAQDPNRDPSSPSRPQPPQASIPLPPTTLNGSLTNRTTANPKLSVAQSPFRPNWPNPNLNAQPLSLGLPSAQIKLPSSANTLLFPISSVTATVPNTKIAPSLPMASTSSSALRPTPPFHDELDYIEEDIPYEEIERQAQQKRALHSAPPTAAPFEIPLPPNSSDPHTVSSRFNKDEDYYEDRPEEGIDDYIYRLESSQSQKASNLAQDIDNDSETSDLDGYQYQDLDEQDMEDLFQSRDFELASQDLIEPIHDTDDIDKDGDEEEVHRYDHVDTLDGNADNEDFLNNRRGFGNKTRKGGDNDDEDEDDDEAFRSIIPPRKINWTEEKEPRFQISKADRNGNEMDVDANHLDEDDLMMVTENEFAIQIQQNKKLTMLSEFSGDAEKTRKHRVHVTCTEVYPPNITSNDIYWYVIITDDSGENMYIQIHPNFALEIFGVSNVEEFKLTQTEIISSSQMADIAKSELSTDLYIKWDAQEHCWIIIGKC